MKEFLTWVKQLLGLKESDRSRLASEVFRGIGEFSHLGEGNQDTSTGKELQKELKKNFTVVGFAPNVSYIREKGSKEDLEALWVHPFATPALLLAHKKLPILVIASGGLRFNETVLNEMKTNIDKYFLTGISG